MLEVWLRRIGALVGSTHLRPPPRTGNGSTLAGFLMGELERTREAAANFEAADETWVPPRGVTSKSLVQCGGHRYLLKHVSEEVALRAESVSLLANACGVPTPVVAAVKVDGRSCQAIGWTSSDHWTLQDRPAVSATALECFLTTRWFNEAIWNLDCWRGNFLTRREPSGRIVEVVPIDFDESLSIRTPEWLQTALRQSFGLVADLGDCEWTSRPLQRHEGLTFQPREMDAKFTAFGDFWKYQVGARLPLPIDAVVNGIELAARLDPAVVGHCFGRYLDYCVDEYRGLVPLRAERTWVTPAEFEELLHHRLLLTARSARRFFTDVDDVDRLGRWLLDGYQGEYRPLDEP